jgi:hypothetical protein
VKWVLILVAACGSAAPPAPPRPPPPPQPARIEVAASECVDASLAARFEQVLDAHHARFADLIVRVDGDTANLRLRVSRSRGDAGLDRTYNLTPADCASAGDLLALGVDRFLTSFPDWAGPIPVAPPRVVRHPLPRWFDAAVRGGANALFVPLGIDAHVGGVLDFGPERHRFGATLLVRASLPQAAGSGSFQQTAFLGGFAYRFAAAPWRFRAEARAGALLVRGIGLAENASDWLPWWEFAAFAGRSFSWGAIGVEVAASGLRDKAVTRDGLVSEDIPLLRLGVAAEFDIWSSK